MALEIPRKNVFSKLSSKEAAEIQRDMMANWLAIQNWANNPTVVPKTDNAQNPLAGSFTYGTNSFQWRSATIVGTSDANGLLPITWSPAFPNGTAIVMVVNGDSGFSIVLSPKDGSTTTSGFTVMARNLTGTPYASSAFRCNYLAAGF